MRAASLVIASVLALGAASGMAHANSSAWPAEADLNGDDQISRDEAMALSDSKFREFDRDGSGDISMAEWRLAIDERLASATATNPDTKGPQDIEAFARSTFQTHDTDSDGKISRGEWDARVDAHFARLDKNGDGVIDRNEVAGMEKPQTKGN